MIDSLREVLSLFSPRHKGRLLILTGLTFIGSLFEVIGVGIVPAFVAAVATPDRFMRYPLVAAITDYTKIHNTNELLLWGVVAVGSVFIFKNVYLALLQYLKLRFLYNRRVMLGNKLFEAYLYAPYTFHLQLVGSLMESFQCLFLRKDATIPGGCRESDRYGRLCRGSWNGYYAAACDNANFHIGN